MRNNLTFTTIVILLLVHSLTFGDTEQKDPKIKYSFNWKNQQLEIMVESYLNDLNKPLPSLKHSIESNLKQKLPYILLDGIELITINSSTTGENFIKQHPNIITSILNLSSEVVKVSSLFTDNFKILNTKYTLDIYPHIAEIFIPHTRTSKLYPILDFIPSSDFTGIIIYVDRKLSMYGKQSMGSFNQSLFPKIFDEKLNLIIGPLMVDPEIIRESGTIGYQELYDTIDLERTGLNPLKLKARGIFGINNTDLLISARDADKILSRQNNLDLIKQGKILIIFNDLD